MEKIFATATSVITPIGDSPEALYESLMAGRSAVSPWKSLRTEGLYSKIGGDLGSYKIETAFESLGGALPDSIPARSQRLMKRLPWASKITLLTALKALVPLNFDGLDWERTGVIVGSSDISLNYDFKMQQDFAEEPDFIDPLYAVHSLDTDHAAIVAEALGARGTLHVVGGACASGNLALKQALDELRYHDLDRVFVISPVFDYSPLYLHSLALVGAIVTDQFNDDPAKASRPFDRRRCGFVPTQAAGCIVLEREFVARSLGHVSRGELLAAESSSDANHLPVPSQAGQEASLRKALRAARLTPADIQYVSAHATSTELGDITEAATLRAVFGERMKEIKVNAAKSLLGHACGASALVELVAVLEQVRRGSFHASANIDELDPEFDFDVMADGPRSLRVENFVKNSFGFGGINCVSVWARGDS